MFQIYPLTAKPNATRYARIARLFHKSVLTLTRETSVVKVIYLNFKKGTGSCLALMKRALQQRAGQDNLFNYLRNEIVQEGFKKFYTVAETMKLITHLNQYRAYLQSSIHPHSMILRHTDDFYFCTSCFIYLLFSLFLYLFINVLVDSFIS
jgi:hypothetical protein